MINIHIDSVTSVIKTEKEAVIFLEIDSVADVFNVGHNRSLIGIFLKIVPEGTLSYAHIK